MTAFNQKPLDQPFEIRRGGKIHLGEEFQQMTEYTSPIDITEIGELQRNLKFDKQSFESLAESGDQSDDQAELLSGFLARIDAQTHLLSLLKVELVGTPVDKLPHIPLMVPDKFLNPN